MSGEYAGQGWSIWRDEADHKSGNLPRH